MITIVEVPEYIKLVSDCLSKKGQAELIEYLAINPESGDVIQGTGGIRKLRWATGGKGKSGGARIIYYYYNESIPLYLITIFKKGTKINISKAEANELQALARVLKNQGE